MYSIGYTGLDSVSAYSTSYQTKNETRDATCALRIARMANKAGREVSASAASTQSAVRSRASDLLFRSKCPGYGLCAEISDADGEDVWPIVAISVMMTPQSSRPRPTP